MKKKLLFTTVLLFILSFALVSLSFAANNINNAVNGIRNFVGGAENVVEDAGQGIANGIRNGVNTVDNGAKNVTNDINNTNKTNNTAIDNRMPATDGNNNGYTATRTATDTGGTNGLLGNINGTMWTWIVLAIVGIVIVALVMYYSKQNNVTTYNHDENDDE